MNRSCMYKRYIKILPVITLLLCMQWPGAGYAQSSRLPMLRKALAAQQDSAGYVSVLGKIGALYASIKLDSSFYYARQVLEISSRLRNKKGMADANNMLGWYYTAKTDYDLGITYAYKALKLNEQLGDSAQMVRALNIIYGCYKNAGQPAEADKYFYRALHMARRLPADNDSMLATILVNYAWRFFNDSTRADSVKLVLMQARQVLKKYPDSRAIFYVEAFEADLMVKAGRGREAENRIYALAGLAKKKGMPYVAMDMYGRLYDFQRLGYYADSTRYQELAYQVAAEAGSSETNLYWLARLYDYYRKERQPDKVMYYSNEIMRLAAENRYHMTSSGVDYIDFFLKEKALQTLSMQNRARQQLLEQELAEKKNKELLAAGLLVVTLLLLALFTSRYLHYRKWKQQEQALSQSYVLMARSHAALTENDIFKNKLISLLASDFRTPLHHIIAVAGHLKTGTLSQPEVINLLRQIGGASRKTLDAFNNILKWIKLQLSGFIYNPVTCRLLPLIASALEPLKTEIADKELSIVNRVSTTTDVVADIEMLELVNVQLLQIAVTVAVSGSLLIISSYSENNKINVRMMVEPAQGPVKLLDELQDWEHNVFALGIVISRDFMKKMKGTLAVQQEARRYLILEYTI